MKSLTIVYSTARQEPCVSWFTDSLMRQMPPGISIDIFIVSFHSERDAFWRIQLPNGSFIDVTTLNPKPTIWQGPHRLTSQDWWAKSNALNTGLCLTKTEWVCFIDDRCVLMPGWIDGILDAMEHDYVVLGAYQKRSGMKVENGEIVEPGIITGEDHRIGMWQAYPPQMMPAIPCGHSWAYGCTVALPTAWALECGGFEQALDGMSAEDTLFGAMLENNGHPLRFNGTMMMVEDRSPDAIGSPMRREDKGISPNDKSHKAIELFYPLKETTNKTALFESRQAVLSGKPFPVLLDTPYDWYDNEFIGHDYMKTP